LPNLKIRPAYKITDFFGDMQNTIFRELKTNAAIDIYRRNLQKLYVDKLVDIVAPAPEPAPGCSNRSAGRSGRRGGGAPRELEQTDVVSVAKARLRLINSHIASCLASHNR
jgi:hypothetical protein